MEIVKINDLPESFPTADVVTKDFFETTNHQMNKEQVNLLVKSLAFRKQTVMDDEEYGDGWGGHIFDKSGVLGTYLVAVNEGKTRDDYFLMIISNNPTSVLSRTTGRPGYSCEQIDQQYWKGPFQDLAYRNPTIYFYQPQMNNTLTSQIKDLNINSVKELIIKNNSIKGFKWDARLNTRWCVTNEGKLDVGIDPNIYPMTSGTNYRYTNYMVATSITFAQYGFLNYYVAETPYIYVGHSDSTTGGGKYYLPFIGLRYRLGAAGEQTAYKLMKNVGLVSQNEKEKVKSIKPEMVYTPNYTDLDKYEAQIVDLLDFGQTLNDKEINKVKDILILNYGYDRVLISEYKDSDLIDEMKVLHNIKWN